MDLVILSVSILICAGLLFFFIGITKTEKIQLDKFIAALKAMADTLDKFKELETESAK